MVNWIDNRAQLWRSDRFVGLGVIPAIEIMPHCRTLGQEKVFIPIGPGRWLTWTATLAGWILATTVIAAVSRTLTRE